MDNTAIATNRPDEQTAPSIEAYLLRTSFRIFLVAILMIILLIGIWSLAALISAATFSGGPLELAKGWLSAVSGI